ncbi:unnamed protein product [Rhizophagus irregularis]|nr:unnamed protein product [Rhizophagus irregularis]
MFIKKRNHIGRIAKSNSLVKEAANNLPNGPMMITWEMMIATGNKRLQIGVKKLEFEKATFAIFVSEIDAKESLNPLKGELKRGGKEATAIPNNHRNQKNFIYSYVSSLVQHLKIEEYHYT